MALNTTLSMKLDVIETLTSSAPDLTDSVPYVTHGAWDVSQVLTSLTTPPATLVAAFQVVLTAGVATINLTSMPGSQGTVNATGKKVRACLLNCPLTNVGGGIFMVIGATNPYPLFGTGSSTLIMKGATQLIYDPAPFAGNVGSTNKTIDINDGGIGSSTDWLNVLFVFG